MIIKKRNNGVSIKTNAGFSLVLVLLAVSLGTVLVSYVYHKTIVYASFVATMTDRERAKQLAYSGLNIALSQLSYPQSSIVSAAKDPENPTALENKKMLWAQLFPSLNRWQRFALTQERDSLNGAIDLCITCEQGKLDFNSFYDYKKHIFPEDKKKVMIFILDRLEKKTGTTGLFNELEQFLKRRDEPLSDLSELLAIKAFAPLQDKFFYVPDARNNTAIYFADIFTVWSGALSLDPWMLSDSMMEIFDCKRVRANDKEERDNIVRTKDQTFTEQTDWVTQWDSTLAPLYGKEYARLSQELVPFLQKQFEPKHFFVLSYGTVGQVKQKILALVERTQMVQPGVLSVRIKKIFWL